MATPWTKRTGDTAAPRSPRALEALHSAVIADRGSADRRSADQGSADRRSADRGSSDQNVSDQGLSDQGVSDQEISDKVPDSLVRRLVRESWERSLSLRLDPDARLAAVEMPGEELRAYRNAHPLAVVLPTLHRLLTRHTFDTGLIVAVGDQSGRLLWIDGDRALRTKAEQMLFVEGANWSEGAMGTSAPGTALALDSAVQIHGAEHFNRIVHPWSCSAVPVHDPDTGAVLGVIDITGGRDAVAPNTLPLIEAAVAAVEAELHFRRLDDLDRASSRSVPHPLGARPLSGVPAGRARIIPSATAHPAHIAGEREMGRSGPRVPPIRVPPTHVPPTHAPPGPKPPTGSGQGPGATRRLLRVLGRDGGQLETESGAVQLSPRHTEILTLLAWYRDGLSADRLRSLLYGEEGSTVSLRSEMVRLRRVLEPVDAALVVHSRPYRLGVPLELDVHRVLAFVERGAHRVALAAYTGHLLPTSQSPGIREIGGEIEAVMRDRILTDGSVETVLEYARTDDAAYDAEVWRTALRLLPPRSPKRATVVARIERIESQLAATLPQPGAP